MCNRINKKSDNNDLFKFVEWVSFLSLIGLFSTVTSAFFLLFTQKQWSLLMLAYIATPFTILTITYLIIKVFLRSKYAISIPFINRKARIVMRFLLIVLVGITATLWIREL